MLPRSAAPAAPNTAPNASRRPAAILRLAVLTAVIFGAGMVVSVVGPFASGTNCAPCSARRLVADDGRPADGGGDRLPSQKTGRDVPTIAGEGDADTMPAAGGGEEDAPESGAPLTVVMMSYPGSDRHHLLRRIIDTVVQWPFVQEVLLVWNGRLEQLPPAVSGSRWPKLRVLPQTANRVDNRWRIAAQVRTDAVLNLDDDIDLKREGAECMLSVWRAAPQSLVALDVRSHFHHHERSQRGPGPHGDWGYAARDTTGGQKRYSIALPRALLTARRYLEAYATAWANASTGVRRIVDELLCDDIALNYIAAAAAGDHRGEARTIYAKARYEAFPESHSKKAMVHMPGMKEKRQRCVNELAAALNVTPRPRYWHVLCSVDG